MVANAKESLITCDEFRVSITDDPKQDRVELIHGIIFEKPMPTQQHGMIAGRFFFYIQWYLMKNPIGHVSVETGHQTPGDDYNSRIPDVSFVRDDSDTLTTQGAVPKMPDIAIEVISPSQSLRELREKAYYYLNNGTRMVLIALPDTQQIEVHTPGNITVLRADDTLDGGDILPDFKVKVADFFQVRLTRSQLPE